MHDASSLSDAVDIADNYYTELEWCLIATDAAQYGDVYQFRVTANGVILTTYTVTPQWTIEASPYSYRKPITIQESQIPDTCGQNLSDFPVLISISGDNDLKTTVNGGDVQNSNGYDIIFKDADGNQLDHEVEAYNGTNGDLTAWVRIPTLDYNDDTVIYMYYGNRSVSSATENQTGVWHEDYQGVWHFDENALDGTTGEVKDSTSNTKNGTSYNMDAGNLITNGPIRPGFNFNGSNEYLDVSDADGALAPANLTIETWIRINAGWGALDKILWKKNNYADATGWYFELRDDAQGQDMFFMGSGTNGQSLTVGWTQGSWHHLVFTVVDNGTNATVTPWLDGTKLSGEAATIGKINSNADVALKIAHGDNYAPITLDDLKISNTVRSDCWIETEYNNQSDPGSFIDVGSETSGSPNTAPDAPTIDNYNTGAWTTDDTPTLQFDLSDPDSGDIVKYQIQIDNNSDFSSPEVDVTEGSGSAEPRSNVTYTPSALANGQYYWRVKAIDDDAAESSWSTANGGSVAFGVDDAAPTNAGCSTPADSATGVSTSPTLTALTAADSNSGLNSTPYYFELATDTGFTQNLQNSGWTADATWNPGTISISTTYYWRVKARDAAGNESVQAGHTADTNGYGTFTTGASSADLTQIHYRWRNDDGGESSSGITETGSATTSGNGTSVSITHGLTINANDVIIAMINANSTTQTISDNNDPYAFEEQIEETGGDTNTYAIYYRVAGASEPASYSWSLSSSQQWSIQIRVFSGVDTASVWDVAPSASTRSSSTTGTTATAPSMNVSNAGAMGILAIFTDATTRNYSNPTNGYGTEVEEVDDRPQVSYIREWASAGVTGTSSATLNQPDDWMAHQFALKPAVGAGATWAANQDTKLTGLAKDTLKRFRFEVSNEGTVGSGAVTYQLQVAETATCGSGSYSHGAHRHQRPLADCGLQLHHRRRGHHNVDSGLTDAATTFVAGELKDTGNATGSITLAADEFTEIEFAVKATS